jgi:hypothetical protein
MCWALFADHLINRLGTATGAESFLEAGLVVCDQDFVIEAGEPFQLGIEDKGEDKGSCYEETAIKIKGGEERFDGIGKEGCFVTASGFFFAAAKPEIAAELKFSCAVQQVIGVDQMGAQLRQFAFAMRGEALQEFLTGHQLEDGVAEKLKLLIIPGIFDALAGEGAVSKRLL